MNSLYSTPTKTAYTLLMLLAVLSTIYNAFIPLHGDEAYYWVWSYHLQGGYYDHAPLLAYMIALSNFISESEWGVRLSAVFSMSIAGLYIFKLTRRMFDDKTALNSLFIYCSVILVHAGFTLVTPDAPLILFWSLSLYYGYIAIFENSTKAYLLLGLFLGLMMLGKYTGILFAFFLLLFALLKARYLFKDWRVYAVMGIAFIVVTPMLWWNYQNEWISFLFQLGHGSSSELDIDFGRFLEFFGGQFGIFTPVFTAVLFYYLVKKRAFFSNEKLFYLSLSILVPLLFFFYKSLLARIELNYTAPAFIGAAVLLAYIFKEFELKKTFKAGIITALALSAIVRIGFQTHLEIVQDRMYGNKEAIALLQSHAKTSDAFYGDHLTIAALMQFYLPRHPNTQIYTHTRFSQYDMWRGDAKAEDGLYLTRNPDEQKLQKVFASVKLLDTLTVQRGIDREKTYYIYRVSSAH
ncbi:MAG: glycosyltransferase family 39 protein [Campylobacterota bacterium]|nr:glycosyltransferase family 39 protein [Campylobacterota bacterium]